MNNSDKFSIPVNSVFGIGVAPTDGAAYAINSQHRLALGHPSSVTAVLGYARSSRYQQHRAADGSSYRPTFGVCGCGDGYTQIFFQNYHSYLVRSLDRCSVVVKQ